MTGFADSGENMTASERRQRRREEARRRVESGENSPPPPPAPTPARPTRSSRSGRTATVDPSSMTGSQFGVWRSVQHFCITDSLPDAVGVNLDTVIAWSDSIQQFRLRQRIVARLDHGGAWIPVCYAKDGSREPITQAQAERYREVRLGDSTLTGGAQKPLKDSDHPEFTTSV